MERRWLLRLRTLFRLARTERASPRGVALALGLGAFVGATPAVGFHGWLAVGAATALRLNRLYAFLGSRISSPVVLPFVVLAEIEVAHRARCGAFLAMTSADVLRQAPGLLVDWLLGTLPVGLAIGCVFAALGYALTRVRATSTPLPDPRSPSGCPPSGSSDRPW
jgi:uncharacterized protein (DUF2062 family)